MHHTLGAALDLLCRAALWVAGVALVLMTLVVGWGVFGRFVLNDTPVWAEPFALLLMGWVILGAAAAGVRENTHMGFGTVRDLFPAPVVRVCDTISDVAIAGFGAGMAWFGAELAAGVWTATLPTLGLPGSVEYAPIVVGGVLILLFGLERLAARLAGRPTPDAALATPLVSDA